MGHVPFTWSHHSFKHGSAIVSGCSTVECVHHRGARQRASGNQCHVCGFQSHFRPKPLSPILCASRVCKNGGPKWSVPHPFCVTQAQTPTEKTEYMLGITTITHECSTAAAHQWGSAFPLASTGFNYHCPRNNKFAKIIKLRQSGCFDIMCRL